MTASDIALFGLGVGLFLVVLVICGIVADSWDSRARRRDARKRNPWPTRTRDHARRIR